MTFSIMTFSIPVQSDVILYAGCCDILNVMLTVVMLSAAMPNAVMLSVGAPHKGSPLLSLQKYYIIVVKSLFTVNVLYFRY